MNDLDLNLKYSNVYKNQNKNMYFNKSDISNEEIDYLIHQNFQFFENIRNYLIQISY